MAIYADVNVKQIVFLIDEAHWPWNELFKDNEPLELVSQVNMISSALCMCAET